MEWFRFFITRLHYRKRTHAARANFQYVCLRGVRSTPLAPRNNLFPNRNDPSHFLSTPLHSLPLLFLYVPLLPFSFTSPPHSFHSPNLVKGFRELGEHCKLPQQSPGHFRLSKHIPCAYSTQNSFET